MARISDVPRVGDGYSWIGSSVAGNGAGLFLFIESEAEDEVFEREGDDFAIFPKPRMAQGKSFRLACLHEGDQRVFELPDLDVAFPRVDRFPDGKILVAGTRCQGRSKDDFDLNGVIVDPESDARSRILLGDGINDIFVDEIGRIWVSYFDEGVFGNLGWGGPGPEPIGASGLNCFDRSGEIVWRYPSHEQGAFGGISDCYALNVSGAEAFIYYYTEFPVCRISEDFQTRCWATTLSGCGQFALSGDRFLFSGQYGDPISAAYLATLGDRKLGDPARIELTLPDGTPIADGLLLGRADAMHFFSTDGWFRITIDEIDL